MTRQDWLCNFRFELRRLLEEKDVSQQKLADRLYVSKSTVSRLLNGDLMPSIKMVVNISYVLNVSIDRFTYFGGRIN